MRRERRQEFSRDENTFALRVRRLLSHRCRYSTRANQRQRQRWDWDQSKVEVKTRVCSCNVEIVCWQLSRLIFSSHKENYDRSSFFFRMTLWVDILISIMSFHVISFIMKIFDDSQSRCSSFLRVSISLVFSWSSSSISFVTLDVVDKQCRWSRFALVIRDLVFNSLRDLRISWSLNTFFTFNSFSHHRVFIAQLLFVFFAFSSCWLLLLS